MIQLTDRPKLEMGRPSLKHQAFSGVKWQVINKVLQKVSSVVTFAFLARILEPSVFGLFAMAFIAIDGLQIFKAFGLDSALVHRKGKLQEASDTAFILIQGLGVVLFLLCYFAAPGVAQFFHQPEIASVIRALGIIFIFTCFSKVPSTLLIKDMRFAVTSAIDLAASLVNCAFAVLFAFLWRNVWSLVAAYLIKQVLITILSRLASGYRFRGQFRWEAAKELLHYGKFMIGLSVLWYLAENLNNVMIGKMLGPSLLGFYVLAENIGNFINTHFVHVLGSVMFPAYASLQHDLSEVRRVYFKTTQFVSLLSFPFSGALIFLAEELVLTVYGAKWLSMVPLIQIFGVLQLAAPILICSGSLYMGCGRPQYNYRLALYTLPVKIPLLYFFTKTWGLAGSVWCNVLVVFLFAPINLYLVHRIVKFDLGPFLKQMLPSIYGTLAMLAVMAIFKPLFPFDTLSGPILYRILPLMLIMIVGALGYGTSVFLTDRSAVHEIMELLLKKSGMRSVQ